MTITIQYLEKSDNESYRSLWIYGITEQAMFFRISPEDDLTTGIPTRFTPDSFTLGAYSQAGLVGIVSVERDAKIKVNHKALVFRMFVHPDAAGCGVGRALLERVITIAKSTENLRYLYLTVLYSFRLISRFLFWATSGRTSIS